MKGDEYTDSEFDTKEEEESYDEQQKALLAVEPDENVFAQPNTASSVIDEMKQTENKSVIAKLKTSEEQQANKSTRGNKRISMKRQQSNLKIKLVDIDQKCN